MGIAFTQSGDSNVGCRLEINRTKIHNQSIPIRPEPVLAISHDAPKPLVNLDLPTKGKSTDNPAETLVLNRQLRVREAVAIPNIAVYLSDPKTPHQRRASLTAIEDSKELEDSPDRGAESPRELGSGQQFAHATRHPREGGRESEKHHAFRGAQDA